MNATWSNNYTPSGDDNIPLTKREKIRLGIVGFGMMVLILVVGVLTWVGQHDQDRAGEVWWTVTCPTVDDPGRRCLDGTVSMDQVPKWAGGYANE